MRKLLIVLLCWAVLIGCSTQSRQEDNRVQAPSVVPQHAPPAESNPEPPPGRVEYDAALKLITTGQYDLAVSRLKQATLLDPNNPEMWNDLSYALLRSDPKKHAAPPGRGRDFQDAVAAARKSLELRPGFPYALYNLGVALLADGHYEDAVEPLMATGILQKERAEALTALGLALMGVGHVEEAIQFCAEADHLEPEFSLGNKCVELAGAGATRLPTTELAVGGYKYSPASGFVWTGSPNARTDAENIKVSWPFTCATAHSDGFTEYHLGCGLDRLPYAWTFQRAAAGSTPGGVGVGTSWEAMRKLYGSSIGGSDRKLQYVVGDLLLTVTGSPKEGVRSIRYERQIPVLLIDDLIHGRTSPPPLSYDERQLAGVRYGATESEVRAVLGEGTVIQQDHGPIVRTYQNGRVKVIFQSNGSLSDVELFQHGETPRGARIGDSQRTVRRLHGKPSNTSPDEMWYGTADHEFFLWFKLENDKVVSIRFGPSR